MILAVVLGTATLATAAGMALAFRSADAMGAASRASITEQFVVALETHARATRIGYVKWTVAANEFRPVVDDAPGRGLTYNGEQSRSKRSSVELEKITWRRNMFYMALGGMAFWGVITLTGAPWCTLLSGLFGAFALWVLALEIAFRFGFQAMEGAMVLDPDLMPLRQQEIDRQKVYGNAAFATEYDAHAAAGRGSLLRSPVHDQEF